jgi:hypothetical protein
MCTTDEFIGTQNVPTKVHRQTFGDIDGAYDIGDMLVPTLTPLNCATRGKSLAMHVLGINVWEKSPAGAQVKASLRFHFYQKQFTPPAQNAPFKGPPAADYTTYLGYHDVVTGLYTEIGDGSGTDPDYAFAQYVASQQRLMRTGSDTNTLWYNIEIREAKTFATPSELTIEIETELH